MVTLHYISSQRIMKTCGRVVTAVNIALKLVSIYTKKSGGQGQRLKKKIYHKHSHADQTGGSFQDINATSIKSGKVHGK